MALPFTSSRDIGGNNNHLQNNSSWYLMFSCPQHGWICPPPLVDSALPCPWCRDGNWMIPQALSNTNYSTIPCSHAPRKEGTAGFVVQGMLVTQGDEGRILNVQSEFWFEQQREKQASSSDLHPELRNVQPHHIPLQKLQIQSSIREQHPCWNPEVLSCQHLLFSSLTPTMVTVLQLLRETPGSMDSLPDSQFYSQLCHCQWGDLRQMFAALILDVSKNPKGLLTRNLFSLCLSVPQGNDLIIYQPSQHLLPPQVQDVLPFKLSLSSQIISPINTTKITQSSFALISPHVQASSFHSTPSLGELSGVFQLHLLAPWTIFLPLVS